MLFDTSIFHDYDIRGVYPKQINEKIYGIIGKALATYIGAGPIGIGHDMRLSSPSLSESLIKGIADLGLDVVDYGLISTEMLYFACGKYNYPANAIVSASHNPPQYNGLKIVKKGVVSLNGEVGLPEVKRLATKNKFTNSPKRGKVSPRNIMKEWINHALTFVNIQKLRSLKIVVDAGNGMAGISWQNLIGKLPIHIIPLYFTPDGSFPHHIPNPLEEKNLVDLKRAILKNKADLGLSFDGDSDRLFILDEKAHILSGTIVTAILTKHLLLKYGSFPILYNAICGRIVPETIKKYGGESIRVRVGHSFIKQYMKKYQALFAGEHSGHYYFRYNYNAESALIAALIFIEYISQTHLPVSKAASEFDKYPQSGEKNFEASDIPRVMEVIRNDYKKEAISIDELDGLSIWFTDFWFNIRASKTEPLLRLNLEADNVKLLDEQTKKLIDKLTSLGAKLKS